MFIGRKWELNELERLYGTKEFRMAVNPLQKKMFLGECKYRNEKIGIQTAALLIERGSLFAGGFQKYYALFPKSGFDEETEKMAREWGMMLVMPGDLYA